MAGPEILREPANQETEYRITSLDVSVSRDQTANFQGRNALVYQGTLHPMDVRVAVKTDLKWTSTGFKRPQENPPEGAFLVQTRAMNQNILPLIGITTKFDSTISIVSTWMAMGNAHGYVQNPAIDPRPLITDIARGMCYLHTYPPGPIIHGDLKGSNVLISDEGRALIADIGFMSLMNSSSNVASYPRHAPSNWIPPEVVEHIFWGDEYVMSKSQATADTTQLLTLMSEHATCFSINLNDQVDRNMNIPPHHDISAIVFQGTLRSDGTKLMVKTVRASLPAGNKQTIEEVVLEMHLWSGLHHENIILLLGIMTKPATEPNRHRLQD